MDVPSDPPQYLTLVCHLCGNEVPGHAALFHLLTKHPGGGWYVFPR